MLKQEAYIHENSEQGNPNHRDKTRNKLVRHRSQFTYMLTNPAPRFKNGTKPDIIFIRQTFFKLCLDSGKWIYYLK